MGKREHAQGDVHGGGCQNVPGQVGPYPVEKKSDADEF